MTLAVFARAAPSDVRPFALVESHDDLQAAAEAWRELEPAGSGYQGLGFARAWADAFAATTRVVIARDKAKRPIALLALHLRRFGPLTVADFVGGPWANYHMGLFRPGVAWREDDVRAFLRTAGTQAGVDLFAFANQPAQWEGRDNPLALLRGAPSPSNAFASALAAFARGMVRRAFLACGAEEVAQEGAQAGSRRADGARSRHRRGKGDALP